MSLTESKMRTHAVRTLALLALLMPFASAHAAKAEKREPGMRWVTDLEAAIAEAKDRNIPLFVAVHKDN
jgi:hypothetical protein